jgi:hypothetical protein
MGLKTATSYTCEKCGGKVATPSQRVTLAQVKQLRRENPDRPNPGRKHGGSKKEKK